MVAAWFYFRDELLQFSARIPELAEIEKQVTSPPPLRGPEVAPVSKLTRSGVFQWTNLSREQNGVAGLKQNAILDRAAEAKVQDMFQVQYFAHVSPAGKDAGDFARAASYPFISIGENLALGNYRDDQDLVQAWLDSPGHRANILNLGYEEIGIAVARGVFEGKTTWLAVQIFGRPLSACPQPDQSLKTQAETDKQQLAAREQELTARRAEIEELKQERGPEYRQKVEEYNTLVQEYNNLVSKTKAVIEEYNRQVNLTNQCITS